MSIYFVTGEVELWNPSNVAGRIFLDQAASVPRLLEVETGMGPLVSDEVELDSSKFIVFVSAFSKLMRQAAEGAESQFLLENCFGIAGALAEKLGASSFQDPKLSVLIAKGRQVVG